MSIDKIILNTPMNEMARKTHLKIYFDDKEDILKMKIDIENKKIYFSPNCEVNNITKMELGEMKFWCESYFLRNFDIKSYEKKNNIIYINVIEN